MVEHATEWLGAYLDGELRGLRLRQVESHLAECAACRSELESLRNLSRLLHDSVPIEAFTPTGRFVTSLLLKLPRRSEVPLRRRAFEFAWWLVPVGVLGLWVFIQTLWAVTSMVTAANQTGLFGAAAAFLQSGPQHMDWFAPAMNLFGTHLNETTRATLEVLDWADVFGQNVLMQLVWQFAIGILYWGWLAIWWLRRQGQVVSNVRTQHTPQQS